MKNAPRREERLGTCIDFGGCGSDLKKNFNGGCLKNNDRGFCQGTICQSLPVLSMLNTIPDSVVIVHGSLGCGGAGHSQSASIRGRQILGGSTNPRGTLWLSTNLNEIDVVNGGEAKLEEAIIEADRRYRPASIIVVSSCVPGELTRLLNALGLEVKIFPCFTHPDDMKYATQAALSNAHRH